MTAEPRAPFPIGDDPSIRSRRASALALRRLRRQPLTLVALSILVVVLGVAALAPEVASQGSNAINLADRWRNHPPMLSGWHVFGTDNIGRDVLVRTLWAVHFSESTALLAALFAALLGLLLGGVAGARGGWVDAVVMRMADLLTAFPALMLLFAAYIVIYQFLLRALTSRDATVLFTLYLWTLVARPVRASVVSLREMEFVYAARALGASELRIFLRHRHNDRRRHVDRRSGVCTRGNG